MKRKPFSSLRAPVGTVLLFLFKFNLALMLVFYAYTLCIIPLLLLNIIGLSETLWPLALCGGMIGLIVLAWHNASNRSGFLFAALPLVYGWWLTNVFFILGKVYEIVRLAGIFGWFFIILTSVVVIFGIAVLAEKSMTTFRARVGIKRAWTAIKENAKNQRGIAAMCLVLCAVCGAYATITIQSFPRGEILVTPQDYHANFAFWAGTSNTSYTDPQLAELNEHGVILAGGWTNVSQMQFWLNHYPNVRFSLVIYGTFCDADAYEITERAKTQIGYVTDNSLTNIIGITLDWEGWKPSNATAHQQAIQIWSDFLDWKAANAPANFTVTLLDHSSAYYDYIDGDMDMHSLWQAVDFQVPRFDEYAPMIYRCTYGGAKPFGDPVSYSSAWGVEDTYSFYKAMEVNAKGVAGTFGNLSRLGIYLGETNCSCYGRDVKVYENGKYMGTGWDMLVQDSLICKAFGTKTITYFLMQANWADGWWMGGGFDAYGDDFLDKLDAAVNGANSTKPFTINVGPISVWKTGLSYFEGGLMMDYLYNIDHPLEFALWMCLVITLGVVLFWRERSKYKKNAALEPARETP